MTEGLEHLFCQERLKKLGLERRRLRQDVINFITENEDEGVRLFSVVPTDRTRDTKHKLKHMKTFTVRTVKHWNRLSRNFVKIIQNQTRP